MLIVNMATGCGFAPQYDELQDLYELNLKDWLEILEFPCNQFAEQAQFQKLALPAMKYRTEEQKMTR